MHYILNETGSLRPGWKCWSSNLLYITHGQHATHFDGDIETVNPALIPLFGRIGFFEKDVIQFQQYSQ
jgi:hypothetical protein